MGTARALVTGPDPGLGPKSAKFCISPPIKLILADRISGDCTAVIDAFTENGVGRAGAQFQRNISRISSGPAMLSVPSSVSVNSLATSSGTYGSFISGQSRLIRA